MTRAPRTGHAFKKDLRQREKMKKLNGKQFMCVRIAFVLLIAYAIAAVEGMGAQYGISWRSFGAFALVVALFAGLFIYAFRDKTEAKEKDTAKAEQADAADAGTKE